MEEESVAAVPAQVIKKIEDKMEEFRRKKAEFSSANLDTLPKSFEGALELLKPLHDALEVDINEMKTELLKCEANFLPNNKGLYFYWLAKISILWDHSFEESISLLEKAVKFIPEDISVWNDLGESHLSIGNIAVAKNCFDEALRRSDNVASYRCLSILCRREASERGIDIQVATKNGVNFAKKAVTLDPNDGFSWTILGNAYMADFLVATEGKFVPTQALQAYSQAERNNGQYPELFFNKAVALLFMENYAKCLQSFREAIKRDPVWLLPWRKYYAVTRYIYKVSEFCSTKGGLSRKKLRDLVGSLNQEFNSYSCLLREYKNSVLTVLNEGINNGTMILGKVLWSCQLNESFPFTFGVVDKLSNGFVVTMFNLRTGKGIKIGDTICITNPNYSTNKCYIDDNLYTIRKIRVDAPKSIKINGYFLPDDHIGQVLPVTQCSR